MSFKSKKCAKALAVLLSSANFIGGLSKVSANNKVNLNTNIESKSWISKNPGRASLIGIVGGLAVIAGGYGIYRGVAYMRAKYQYVKPLGDNEKKSDIHSAHGYDSKNHEVGSGQQGSVALYVNRNTGEKVVIKKVRKHDKYNTYEHELLAMNKLRVKELSPNITKPIEYYEDDKYAYFVYEYVEDDIAFWKERTNKMSLNDRKKFILDVGIQIVKSIIWFEKNNLCYSDFKLLDGWPMMISYKPNLFITRDENNKPLVKIFDFGILEEGKWDIKDSGEMRYLCDVLRQIECIFITDNNKPSYLEDDDSIVGEFCLKLNCPQVNNREGMDKIQKFENFDEALKYLENEKAKLDNN